MDAARPVLNWEAVRLRLAAAEARLAGLDAMAPAEREAVWARRAAQLAQVAVGPEEGERIDLVLIRLGRQVFGLEAQYVRDIRPLEQMRPVPRVPPWLCGMVNLRGRVVSVFDVTLFWGLVPGQPGGSSPAERRGGPYLVVVEIPGMELALRVDDVLGVEPLPVSSRHAAGDAIWGAAREHVRGVIPWTGHSPLLDGDCLVVEVDLPALLADRRLIVREGAI